ncbi:T9SS type A sorting domain-containing protein [Chryseobacterium sp. GMJ5]|uniref:T9SS type A sorting domain-containing protein n=1 Tax=Chryseobacterium gilvum TaxID=2976534 RepID=A0ABT2VUI9_9FLAO|nr:T9SS type A sorting domain-containing protein [Chryseobacterium gilvum]MCU7613259.1 T9SS type A sorting domain-containing protein [Chryseobacterium gilvum]
MKKILLSCLMIFCMTLHAQITLGAGSTDTGTAPISTYYGYSYVQQIFTKQEINANAAGNITGLKFYLPPSSDITNSANWVVYLGTTSKTSFTSTADWVPLSQMTQVFSGNVTNNNGVVQITFPTPFPYNNVGNLVLAAEENSSGYDENSFEDIFYVYNSTPNSVIYYKSDNTNPNPASPPNGVLSNEKSEVTFLGLAPSATIACPGVISPANNSDFVSTTPNISWLAVPGATGYKVSIGTTPGGTDILNQQSVATTSFTLSQALGLNTMYYLKVTAVGTSGESQGCSNTMFKTKPAPPLNNECANAVTLTVNPDLNCGMVTAGYTLDATDSGISPNPCYGNPDDDVWYKFIATATSHKISLNSIVSVGSDENEDMYFQVFSGTCGSLVNVLCSDPSSAVISGLTIGTTYYVRVYSYDGTGSNQSFTICIGKIPPPPANDACSGALAATVFPYTYTQSDAGGSTNNAGFITGCSNDMNDGTWFKFTGNGSVFNINVSMPSGSNFDPQVGVYNGTCGALSCVSTIDDGGDGEAEALSLPTVSGTVYYVNVGQYSGSSDELEDNFTITISTGTLGTSENGMYKTNVKAYPNPFTDVLNISEAENIQSATITDMSGKLVKTIENPSSVIHLQDLKAGVYLLSLWQKDNTRQTIKIIKK